MTKPFNHTASLILLLTIGVTPPFLLLSLGFDILLVTVFSISLLLLWTDGLLTYYALKKGALEINPIINLFNRIKGKRWGIIASRVIGSVLASAVLVSGNLYGLLAVAWLFAVVVCFNSSTLLVSFEHN